MNDGFNVGVTVGVCLGVILAIIASCAVHSLTYRKWRTEAISVGVGELYLPHPHSELVEFRWKTNTVFAIKP